MSTHLKSADEVKDCVIPHFYFLLDHVLLKMDIRKFFAIEGPKMESIAFEERWNFFLLLLMATPTIVIHY